jgi:polyisoprenyl-teichoic acid--peptidoglycan teichoic acid transferase
MSFEGDSSYSRLPAGMSARPRSHKHEPKATRGQKAIEVTLFAVFGFTIALAGVALYATNRPEHNRVPNRVADGVREDRVNILLIGASLRTNKAGATQVQPESLMLLSVQPSTGRTALTSIPTDLWVKVGRYGQRPLRAAYQVGDAAGYPGAGNGLLIDTLETIIDEPIHGFARLSIGDVSRIVDTVGGIEVEVKRGVYEARGDRHRFRRGQQTFNGIAAMHYAYSGSLVGFAADRFEREQRQREVALSTLGKLLGSSHDLSRVASALGSVAQTNLTGDQIRSLVSAARRGDGIRIVTFKPLLDTVDVTSVAYRGEAVQPRDGDFAHVRKLTDTVFSAGVVQIN